MIFELTDECQSRPWTHVELRDLREGMAQDLDWYEIAARVGSRTSHACQKKADSLGWAHGKEFVTKYPLSGPGAGWLWTDAKTDRLVEAWHGTWSDVVRATSRTAEHCEARASEIGLPPKGEPIVCYIRRERKVGVPFNAISAALGMSESALRNIAGRHGIIGGTAPPVVMIGHNRREHPDPLPPFHPIAAAVLRDAGMWTPGAVS
jgi:hypothetical protein